jgi:hypothetical protein
MKMLHPKGNFTPTSSTTAATTTPGSTPLAPPTLDGSVGSVGAGSSATPSSGGARNAATSSDGVVDASSPLPADSGQLYSFSRFKSKDPFVQQLTECSAPPCASAGSSPAGGSGTSTTAGSGSSTGTGSSAPSSSGSGSSSSGAADRAVTTASISVNGRVSKVTADHTFPAGDPVFVLVSVTAKAAKIAISGGSLDSGSGSLTLPLGKTVTLENTTDGARYVLKLVGTA